MVEACDDVLQVFQFLGTPAVTSGAGHKGHVAVLYLGTWVLAFNL